jgi:hypothetical protein
MDFRLMFPGKFVSAADLKGADVTLTIQSVAIQKLEGSDGTAKVKGVVTFEGASKAWILNRTCAEACHLMWGPETNAWVGKRITLYPQAMKDPFGDGEIIAVRVRGSPDLKEPRQATVQRGRKTIKVSVRPTGHGGQKQSAAPQQATGLPDDHNAPWNQPES